MKLRTLPLISAQLLTCLVGAQLHNVTIDDSDPSITYDGDWDNDSFQVSPLDYGGSHTVSEDPGAMAILNFTGVAVYYMSPLWPFPISVAISVDNGNSATVDLRDYSSPPSPNSSRETVQSQVVWASSSLTNDTHSVVISMADDSQFVVVDGFVYTILDASDQSTTSQASSSSTPTTSLTSSTNGPPTPSAIAVPETSSTSLSSRGRLVAVIAGTVGGLVVLISIAVVIWVRHKSRRKPRLTDFWD